MNTVTFDEEPRALPRVRAVGGLTGWLMRKGVVTTPSQANLLMLFLAIICFSGALFLFNRTVTAEKIDPLKNFVPAYSTHKP